MYIKTKHVLLKNGKMGVYFYVAMSVRRGKQVYPRIIKYVGKCVPYEILNWIREKNVWLKEKHKQEQKVRQC